MVDHKSKLGRRKHVRIEKPYIISFYEKHDPEKKHDITQIKDISWDGICFVSSKPYKAGTSICIETQISPLEKPTHLEGTVLRSLEKVTDLLYEHHIVFHNLNPHAEAILKKIIKNSENGH